MVASGALAFDGKGWPWEKPLVRLGFIKPEIFTIVIKTLTLHPRRGNLQWSKPWECVRLIRGGSVNKIGLTNPGIEWWCREVGPHVDSKKIRLVGSIFGTREELIRMTRILSEFNLVGLEVNDSCPNSGDPMKDVQSSVDDVKAVRDVSKLPVITKVSVAQDYSAIALGLKGIAEAISLNAVPWEIAFPGQRSSLWKLEKKVGGGGGGVSGTPAQKHNWKAVGKLSRQESLPVIGPDIMEFDDLEKIRWFGAKAVSFGAIHFRTPWKPTSIVKKENV